MRLSQVILGKSQCSAPLKDIVRYPPTYIVAQKV